MAGERTEQRQVVHGRWAEADADFRERRLPRARQQFPRGVELVTHTGHG